MSWFANDKQLSPIINGLLDSDETEYYYLYGSSAWDYYVLILTNKRFILIRLKFLFGFKAKDNRTIEFHQIKKATFINFLLTKDLVLILKDGTRYYISFNISNNSRLIKQKDHYIIIKDFINNKLPKE